MKIEYSSNNSGGRWWLSDKQWLALEKAGWTIEWGGLYFCHTEMEASWSKKPDGKPEPCKPKKCSGHRRADSLKEAKKGKLDSLEAFATSAVIDSSPKEAILNWEKSTGESADDMGCGCCGPPHSFSWKDSYASGEDVVGILYKGSPSTLREAAERLEDEN